MNVKGKKILLIEAGHPHRHGQVFLPGGMLNFAARLLTNKAEVNILDLTLDKLPNTFGEYDAVMISVFAKPYLVGAANIAHIIRGSSFTKQIIVGGQGTEALPEGLLKGLMPEGVELWQAHDLQPSREHVGIQGSLALLPKQRVLNYIQREFGIYMSDGCAFRCNFCDAHCRQPEVYRDLEVARAEFVNICERLQKAGRRDVFLYLSNLDGFQNAERLREHLFMLKRVADEHNVCLHARCLSTAWSFVRACEHDKALLPELRKLGLEIIAFGADGADPRVWQRERKTHNSLTLLQSAYSLCKESGVTAEALMVIGFHDDDIVALGYSLMYSLKWAIQGVVIRPYLGKPIASSLNREQVQHVLNNPQLLLNLDYAMCGSELTHPRIWQRLTANVVYLGLIALLTPLRRNTTFPLMPRSRNHLVDRFAQWVNRVMPADR